MKYHEEHVSDQSKAIKYQKENENRQFGTTSLNYCDNNLCLDGKNLEDHATTHFNSCYGFTENKVANLTTDDSTQFVSMMKFYSLKNEEFQKDEEENSFFYYGYQLPNVESFLK